MSLEALKKEVYEANMELVEKQLVISTWGNVSGYDEESGLMVIKPSGVPYKELRPDQMVPVDLNGNVVDSDYVPSTDTDTHSSCIRHSRIRESAVLYTPTPSLPPCGRRWERIFPAMEPHTATISSEISPAPV